MQNVIQSQLAALCHQYNAAIRALKAANKLKRRDIKSRVFKSLNRIRHAINAIPVPRVVPVFSVSVVDTVLDGLIHASLTVIAVAALSAPFLAYAGL